MHEILDRVTAEADRELADLRDAEQALRERAAQQRADYEQRMAEWRGRQQTAVLAGQEPPPQPDPPPDERDAVHILLRRGQQLAAERRRVVADAADDLEAQLAAREEKLRGKVQALLAKVEPFRAELDELLAAARHVRTVADAERGVVVKPSRVDRMRGKVDQAALLEIADGSSVLDVAPVMPTANPITSAPEPHQSPAEQHRLDEILRDVRVAMARGVTL